MKNLHLTLFSYTDELIRQIAVNTPERAVILTRCRDELRENRAAYCSLYASSESFRTRKSIRRYSAAMLAKNVELLREESATIRKVAEQLNEQVTQDVVRHNQEMDKLDKKHNEELEYLKIINSHLKVSRKHSNVTLFFFFSKEMRNSMKIFYK
jgi:Axonemal dynein light chain